MSSSVPVMVAEAPNRAKLYEEAAEHLTTRWNDWLAHCRATEEPPGDNVWREQELRLRTLAAEKPHRVAPWADLEQLPDELLHRIRICRDPLPLEVHAYWIRPGDRVRLAHGETSALVVGVSHARGLAELRVLEQDGTDRIRTRMPHARVWVLAVEEVEERPLPTQLPQIMDVRLREAVPS